MSPQTQDRQTPIWAWLVVLSPLLILLLISVGVYTAGYTHAKSVSESLIPIEALVTSAQEQVCGGHARHVCYRIELSGNVDGIAHRYRTYDRVNGRFTYGGVQTILVEPHPGNGNFSPMCLNKSDPVDEFKANSTILLFFIAFELGCGPVLFWLTHRKEKANAVTK
jgi:hypothetical protein